MGIGSLGEFGFIDMIRSKIGPLPEGIMGIGDDCAVIPISSREDLIVTTDLLVEDVHFLRGDISAWRLGWKSVAVNISDIAAMGGKPLGTFLSIALPKDVEPDWAEEFTRGYMDISRKFDTPLLGGDTTSSKKAIAINVAVLGTVPSGKAKLRSAAVPGDLVCCTGTLGDSGAGLEVILKGYSRSSVEEFLLSRHYEPVPRVSEGLELVKMPGVHAMMDISDGIGSDLVHILRASGVAASIALDKLPLSSQLVDFCGRYGLSPEKFAISSGEDYELLFTVSPSCRADIEGFATVIGEIREGEPGIEYLKNGKPCGQEFKGYVHF